MSLSPTFLISALPLLGRVFGFSVPPSLANALPAILALAQQPQLQEAIKAGQPALDKLLAAVPSALPVLKEVAAQLFPAVTEQLSHVAAAQAIFDPDWIKEAQTRLNSIASAGLKVDGVCGARTQEAVKAFQKLHQPDAGPVDGWPGPKTMAVLRAA